MGSARPPDGLEFERHATPNVVDLGRQDGMYGLRAKERLQ